MKTNSFKKRVSRKRKANDDLQNSLSDGEKVIDDLKKMILDSKRRVSLSHARFIDK